MSLHADTIIDRIRLKSQITRWRVLTIAIAVIALLAFLEKGSPGGPIHGNYVARLSIEGIITDNRDLSNLIHDLRDDKRAKAVIVWMDTPGGSGVGGQQLYYDLRDLAKEKPVIAVMRSLSASAGYMAALGTDRIIAREGTITGSIGVLLEAAEFTELAKKIGVQPIIFKTGENKAAPSPLEKLTPHQAEVLQAAINDFFQWFKNLVAERRKLPIATVDRLADGRIYSGKQALDNHLIDQLGGEDEAMDWLNKTRHIDASLTIRDVKVKKKDGESFFQDIARGTFSSLTGAQPWAPSGISALWRP